MPAYTVELLQDALNEIEIPMKGTPVGILGVAYKANVDDVRESPSVKIQKLIQDYGCQMSVFDPHISEKSTAKTLEELLEKSEAIILVTDHKEFKSISPETFKKHGIKVIIDGKNCLDKDAIKKLGIIYKGIGR